MSETTDTRDEVIEAIRAVREAYAAQFNYDVGALFRHAREQAKRGDRDVVRRPSKPLEETAAAPGVPD